MSELIRSIHFANYSTFKHKTIILKFIQPLTACFTQCDFSKWAFVSIERSRSLQFFLAFFKQNMSACRQFEIIYFLLFLSFISQFTIMQFKFLNSTTYRCIDCNYKGTIFKLNVNWQLENRQDMLNKYGLVVRNNSRY